MALSTIESPVHPMKAAAGQEKRPVVAAEARSDAVTVEVGIDDHLVRFAIRERECSGGFRIVDVAQFRDQWTVVATRDETTKSAIGSLDGDDVRELDHHPLPHRFVC